MALINNETYVKLQLHIDESSSLRKNPQTLFVKGTWYPRHFLLSVLDGCDTWTLHASEELVAIAAGEWEMAVEEYLDQLQLQFSVQNPDSSFSFIPASDTITLLECSFLEEKSHMQHSVTIELEKKQRCGKVAYDILGNLLEHNSKQNDELAHKTRDILRMNAELNELKFAPKTDLSGLRSKPMDQTELQPATSVSVLPDQDTARRLQPFITKPQQQILSSGKTTGLNEPENNQSAQQSDHAAGRKTFQETMRHGPRDMDCKLNEAENNAATSPGRKVDRPAEVMVESHSQESEELSSSVLENEASYGPGARETTATAFTRNLKIVPDDEHDELDLGTAADIQMTGMRRNPKIESNESVSGTVVVPATGWRRNSRIEAYELQSETPEIHATRLRQNLKTEPDDADFATAEIQTTWLRRNSKNGSDEGETQSTELKEKKSSYTGDPKACRLETPEIQAIGLTSNLKNEFDELETQPSRLRSSSYTGPDEYRHDAPENQAIESRRNESDKLEHQALASRSSYAGVVEGSSTRLATRLETPGILVTGSRRNSRNEFDETHISGGSRKSLHTRIDEESSSSGSPEIQPTTPGSTRRRNSKIESNESETRGASGGSRRSSYARFDESSRPESPTESRVTSSRRNSKNESNDPETRASSQTRKDSYIRIDESSWSEIPEAQVTTAGSRRNSRNEFDDELETTRAPGGSRRSSSSARPHESTSRQVDSHEMIRISRRNSTRNELDDYDEPEALAFGSRKNLYAAPEMQEAASRRRDPRIEPDDEIDTQISRSKRNSYATAFDESSSNSRPQSPEIQASRRRDSRNRFDELDEAEKRRSISTTRRSSNDSRFDESSAPAETFEKQQQISASRRNSRNEFEAEEDEEAQGSSGFMSKRSSSYVRLDASDDTPQIPEKQVQTARRNSRNNGFDDEKPETRTSRSRTSSYAKDESKLDESSTPRPETPPEIQLSRRRDSRNAVDEVGTELQRSRRRSSSHARVDNESSRQQWPESPPDLLRRNSRTREEFDEHETQGSRNSFARFDEESTDAPAIQLPRRKLRDGFDEFETQGVVVSSRNSPYVRVDQSSRHESPEIQVPRRNSRNGLDEPETHASAAAAASARRSSFARLDESSGMNPEGPEVQASKRDLRNGFDEMQVSGLKRSAYVNDSRSETPEIRAISGGTARRESNTGFIGVDGSSALSETQGTTSSRGSRRNSKIVFNEPETQAPESRRKLYTGVHAAADESSMLDNPEQLHQVTAVLRRTSQNAFDGLETQQSSGPRRNSSSSSIRPDGESPTRPETTAEIQQSGSRRHSSIGFDEVDNQATGLRRNSNRGF